MRKRRRAASHDLVEQRHAACVRVEHAEGTAQGRRLQPRHAHVHELARHEHRGELGGFQNEEPVPWSRVLVHGYNRLFIKCHFISVFNRAGRSRP